MSVKSLCWWFLFHDIISFDKYGEFQILCISVQLLLAGTGVQDYHILHVYGGENRWVSLGFYCCFLERNNSYRGRVQDIVCIYTGLFFDTRILRQVCYFVVILYSQNERTGLLDSYCIDWPIVLCELFPDCTSGHTHCNYVVVQSTWHFNHLILC